MNRRWSLSNLPRHADAVAPPVWLLAALYVFIQLIGVALRVYTWPKGQPVMVREFWFGVVVTPALAWLATCSALVFAWQQDQNRATWWNYLLEEHVSGWRAWAQMRIVVVDSVVLSPEPDLAERMLKLEGTLPENPGKALLLSGIEPGHGGSRLQSTFERLLAPLAPALNRMKRAERMEVVFQTESENDVVRLRLVWDRLKLPHAPTFQWLAPDAPSPLAGAWFAIRPPECRLVIACQLHTPEVAPTLSEVAVALLLTTPKFAARIKIKPQASIFRPISADFSTAAVALATLVRSEQTPLDKLRHFWATHLSKVTAHAVHAAVNDSALKVEYHDIDKAIGKGGPANRWLAHALACEMAQHGQGAQLIAVPHGTGLAWSLVAIQPAAVPCPVHPPIRYFSWAFLAMVVAFVACLFCILLPAGLGNALKIVLIAAIPVMVFVQVGAEIWMLKQASRAFANEAR